MSESGTVSRERAWLIAARPHTLPAAVAPVFVGTGLAIHDDRFAVFPALAALLGAILLQIGANFANDYYDARKGADEDAVGFTRVTQSGLVPPEQVRYGMIATFGSAIALGTTLVYVGGLPILIVGLASVAAGILYSGGPYPFGYYGLGDLFVFVFFGLIAVTGTYYVQAVATMASVGPLPLWIPSDAITLEVIGASLPMAALITSILVINNLRDIDSDRQAGKYTLAVWIGTRGTRIEFLGLLAIAYFIPVWFVRGDSFGILVLTPMLTLPIAASIARVVLSENGESELNGALERAGQLVATYAVLFGVGLAV